MMTDPDKEFKALVAGIDLTLSDNVEPNVIELLEKEETLLALKELYDNDFITKDEYLERTLAIVNNIQEIKLIEKQKTK
jgi:uncharacterized protein YqgQ